MTKPIQIPSYETFDVESFELYRINIKAISLITFAESITCQTSSFQKGP